MHLATDSAIWFSRVAFTTVLGLAAALNGVGCARLDQFRQKDRPVLGALAPGRGKADDKTAKSTDKAAQPVDAYAQSLKNKRAQADQSLVAERDASSQPKTSAPAESLAGLEQEQELNLGSGSPGGGARGGTALPVSLQPPVSLDDKPALAANTAPSSGRWERRDALDESDAMSAVAAVPRRSKPSQDAGSAEAIVKGARERLEKMNSYQVHINRQERVGASLLPVEDVLLSVRRSPKAVRLEWPDGPHKGREVIYSASDNNGLMQVNMADSLVPVPRLSLPPDSPLVMSNSRHPITEAGFDTIVRNMERAIELEKAGTPTSGKLKYEGLDQPDGLDRPSHKLVRVTPSGETWLVYIDPNTKLPALVQANAADGTLLERYLFLDPKGDLAELSQPDAFDVAVRWGPPKGLLSRLTRPGSLSPKPAGTETIVR
ncbi:MAG: DUF1571 domain-containing protein [Isosphaeraceae bacterium]|nr:DUF1571 domain-containing protein [Isosphaeraceae bacterium]